MTSQLKRQPGAHPPGSGLLLIYAWTAWVLFNLSALYFLGFIADLLVPKTVDSGPVTIWPLALLINLELLALFGIQHSVMARPWFKQWLARYLHPAAERSTYVLASVLVFILLFWLWRPMPVTIWRFEAPLLQTLMWLLFAAGWALMAVSTTWISQADLLGLRQARYHYADREYRPVPFQVRAGYRYCRHPMMLGVIIGVWATPHLTVGHALLAAGFTVYILIGVYFEEREAAQALGDEYRAYRERVPMLIPWPGRSVPVQGQRSSSRADAAPGPR